MGIERIEALLPGDNMWDLINQMLIPERLALIEELEDLEDSDPEEEMFDFQGMEVDRVDLLDALRQSLA